MQCLWKTELEFAAKTMAQKFDLSDVLSIPNLHACLSIFYLHTKSKLIAK